MDYHISPREFLIQHLTEGKGYQAISETYEIPRTVLTDWWNTENEIRERIKRANQLFGARTGEEAFAAFDKIGKRGFFEWFDSQPRVCGYCGIEESKLNALFKGESVALSTKRGRGAKLELERKDSKTNEYSENNCIMACYLCNNHKSDLISEEDHRAYFAPVIRQYLEDKYQRLNGN